MATRESDPSGMNVWFIKPDEPQSLALALDASEGNLE